MNKEEIDKWLDEQYGCCYTRLEEIHDFYFEKYCDLKQENQQLKQMVNFGGITITNCPNCKKEITVNFCRETENYRKKNMKMQLQIMNMKKVKINKQ